MLRTFSYFAIPSLLGLLAISTASIVDGMIADALSPHWAALVFAVPALVAAVVVRRGTVRGGEPAAAEV